MYGSAFIGEGVTAIRDRGAEHMTRVGFWEDDKRQTTRAGAT